MLFYLKYCDVNYSVILFSLCLTLCYVLIELMLEISQMHNLKFNKFELVTKVDFHW